MHRQPAFTLAQPCQALRQRGRTLSGACLLIFTAALLAVRPAQAQDYGAMIQQQMAAMNANLARGQQQINQMVQQRMQDPAVQRAWSRYLQSTGGRPAMDYPTFTYNYIYTNGFSAEGVAHARRTEAGIQQREQASVQALRQAERERGQAQQGLNDSYHARQQEAGRQLTGQSTYIAPDGQALVLPHTWQRNGTYRHQGQTYHVDGNGQYHVLASNGWWYPLAAR
jgi:hypothetical protein